MDILPIKFLTDEDKVEFGSLNVYLGKLAREGFPVVDGLITISPGSEPKIEYTFKNLKAKGSAFYNPEDQDVKIEIISGKVHPKDLKIINDIVIKANKKLFMPFVYHWVVDGKVKLIGLSPYTPPLDIQVIRQPLDSDRVRNLVTSRRKSAVKVFLDLSEGLVVEKEVDGIFIASDKISDFEELTFKLVESAATFSSFPILVKLDKRIEPVAKALDFVRHKKGLSNIHIVIPSVRISSEFIQIKRELATRKLMRKHSLQIWLELSIPENIINLEDYLSAGLDGVILNLDQLIAHLNGFNLKEEEYGSYKKEVKGLLRFLEDGIKLLHKSKVPIIAFGSISLYPEVLDYLVEKGISGIVAERYEFHSMGDLLNQAEKRMILRKSQ